MQGPRSPTGKVIASRPPTTYLAALLFALLVGCDDSAPQALAPAPTATPSAQAVQVEETADAVIIRSAVATLRVDKTSVHLSLAAADGAALTDSAAAPTLVVDGAPQALRRVG